MSTSDICRDHCEEIARLKTENDRLFLELDKRTCELYDIIMERCKMESEIAEKDKTIGTLLRENKE